MKDEMCSIKLFGTEDFSRFVLTTASGILESFVREIHQWLCGRISSKTLDLLGKENILRCAKLSGHTLGQKI